MVAEKTLRVGIVGVGGIARHYHLPSYRRYPEFDVVAAADVRREALADLSSEYGIANTYTDHLAMLEAEDLDLISVCTSNDMHYSVVMDAIRCGVDVYCEKPLALNLKEAQEMYGAAESAGIRTGVNFSHRRTPASRLAQDIIASGALGEIHYVSAVYAAGGLSYADRPATWRNMRDRAGFGGLGDMGSHVMDMMMWWLDCGITAVCAQMSMVVPERVDADTGANLRVTTEDQGLLLLRYANGAQGYLYGGYVFTGRGYDQRAEVYGSDGGLMYDQQHPYELQVRLPEADMERFHVLREGGTHDRPYTTVLVPDQHLGVIDGEPGARRTVLMDFLDAYLTSVDTSAPFAFSPSFREGLAVQEVLEGVLRSDQARCFISLPL